MAAVEKTTRPSLDARTITAVTREVIARLRAVEEGRRPEQGTEADLPSKTSRTAASIAERLITVSTIAQLPRETAELFVTSSAVVTPAARDEAASRGITINYGEPANQPTAHAPVTCRIVDRNDPNRAAAVAAQLSRRAIALDDVTVILTDTPARELYQQCAEQGKVAAMAGSLEEVTRFARELDATVWILDMQRLNLPAAANLIARIARNGRPSR